MAGADETFKIALDPVAASLGREPSACRRRAVQRDRPPLARSCRSPDGAALLFEARASGLLDHLASPRLRAFYQARLGLRRDRVRAAKRLARRQVDPERRAALGRERRTRTRAKIIAAAFEILGEERGLYSRAEDVAAKAGVTRATFYNHFAGLADLREALSIEVTHDFLGAVTRAISRLPDARDRSALAVRFYLRRACADPRWAWSMINLSAASPIFGAETFGQAERTVCEGMEEGVFRLPSAQLGRDLLLGSTLAAMGSIVRGGVPDDYPEAVAGRILLGLGVAPDDALARASAPLPPLDVAGAD